MATLNFSTRSRLNRVLYTRESPQGTPYAVGLATDNEGREHTVLACSKRFGDLDHLRLLEGEDLDLVMTENGLQVKPLGQQPHRVQERLIAALEAGEGQRASEKPIPHVDQPLPKPKEEEGLAEHAQHKTGLPNLCELATTVANLASELGLATAMWVHLPNE